jgi:hypothetical protein
MSNLTVPQAALLARIEAGTVVRHSRNQERFLIDGAFAKPHETRVIYALQEKRLVKWARREVNIVGMVGTKTVFQLVCS